MVTAIVPVGPALVHSALIRRGASNMNGGGFLLWLASVIAVISIPLVSFALLMRLVGRIATRTLVVILAADSVFWAMAAYFWWARSGV